MGASVTRNQTDATTVDDLDRRFRDAGLSPRSWANEPHYRYEWHDHDRHKILFCVEGSITFHTRDEDFLLEGGDRLDIEPHTSHAATVHEEGVSCIEALTDGPEALS